ncbi:formate dehydrogenase (NAD+), partial [Ascosphaera pollenicola]
MSRSAADATRFTATGPHASAKIQDPTAQASSSSGPGTSSIPPNETPKQKVERLRAQARAQRMAKNF